MILKMGEVLNYGVMAAITMENIEMDKNMEKECITGQMVQDMQEVGNKMKCMEMVNLYGQMAENIKALLPLE